MFTFFLPLVVLLAIGLPLFNALGLVMLTALGSISMRPISRRVGIDGSFTAGLTLFFCAALPLLGFVVVLGGGLYSTISLSAVVLALLLVFLGAARELRSLSDLDEPFVAYLILIALGSLVSKMWYHLLPLFVGTAMFMLIRMYVKQRNVAWVRVLGGFSFLVVAGGAWWSRKLSSTPWAEGTIFRTSDQYFRASLGIGTTTFGINENMGAAGNPIRYHWMSEAFMTLLGRLTQVSPVDAIVWLSPVVGSLVAVAATYVLVSELGGSKTEALFGSLMISAFSVLLYSQGINILKTTEMGQFWGTPLFIFGVLLLHQLLKDPSLAMASFVVGWYPLLVMTNTTLGLSFACGVGAVLVVAVFKRTIGLSIAAFLLAGLGAVLLVLRRSLLESTSFDAFSPRIQLNDPFSFAVAFGYEGDSSWEKVAVGLGFLAVLWFQGGASLGLRSRGRGEAARSFLSLFTFASVVPAFVINLMEGLEQYRFLNPILILGPASFALCLSEIRQFLTTNRVVISGLFASALFLGLRADVLAKTFGSFDELRPRLVYAALLVLIPLSWFLVAKLMSYWRIDSKRNKIRAIGVFGLFSLLVQGTALIKMAPGQFEYAHRLIGPSISNEARIACLDFVRKITDRESVIASYMWRFGADSSTEKWFLVSAVSERKTFVDGPIYVENPQSDSLKLRQDITTRFVEIEPNYADRAVMLKAGVEYFVVDTRWTKRQTWRPYADRVFSNSDCIVLRLNKPVS